MEPPLRGGPSTGQIIDLRARSVLILFLILFLLTNCTFGLLVGQAGRLVAVIMLRSASSLGPPLSSGGGLALGRASWAQAPVRLDFPSTFRRDLGRESAKKAPKRRPPCAKEKAPQASNKQFTNGDRRPPIHSRSKSEGAPLRPDYGPSRAAFLAPRALQAELEVSSTCASGRDVKLAIHRGAAVARLDEKRARRKRLASLASLETLSESLLLVNTLY